MAQDAGRAYRIGILVPTLRTAPQQVAFFDQLKRVGFVEGQNLVVDFRSFGQQADLVPKFALELVNAGPDVIVADGEIAIHTVQVATATVPFMAIAKQSWSALRRWRCQRCTNGRRSLRKAVSRAMAPA